MEIFWGKSLRKFFRLFLFKFRRKKEILRQKIFKNENLNENFLKIKKLEKINSKFKFKLQRKFRALAIS